MKMLCVVCRHEYMNMPILLSILLTSLQDQVFLAGGGGVSGHVQYRSDDSVAGSDPAGMGGWGDWGDHPPNTYGSNFIHHDFLQFGKQH